MANLQAGGGSGGGGSGIEDEFEEADSSESSGSSSETQSFDDSQQSDLDVVGQYKDSLHDSGAADTSGSTSSGSDSGGSSSEDQSSDSGTNNGSDSQQTNNRDRSDTTDTTDTTTPPGSPGLTTGQRDMLREQRRAAQDSQTERQNQETASESNDELDSWVTREEGAPDLDNSVIQGRISDARSQIEEESDFERGDYTLTVTDSGWVEFGGFTDQGETKAQLNAANQTLESEFGEDAISSVSIIGVTDDGFRATGETEAGEEFTRNFAFSDDAGDYFEDLQTNSERATRNAARAVQKDQSSVTVDSSGRMEGNAEDIDAIRNATRAVTQDTGKNPWLVEQRDKVAANIEQETGLARGEDFSVNVDRNQFDIGLTDSGRDELRHNNEEFGDYAIRVPFTGGEDGENERLEDILGGAGDNYSKLVSKAAEQNSNINPVTTIPIWAERAGTVVQQDADDRDYSAIFTGEDLDEGSIETFTEGAAKGTGELLNIPNVAVGLKEGAEFAGYASQQTTVESSKLLGVDYEEYAGVEDEAALSKTYGRAREIGGQGVTQLEKDPAGSAGILTGSLIGSYAIMGGAASVSSKAGKASRFAIQPGEEIALVGINAGAKRTATGARLMSRLPGGRLDNEELAIYAGRKGASKAKKGFGTLSRTYNQRLGDPGRVGAGLVPPKRSVEIGGDEPAGDLDTVRDDEIGQAAREKMEMTLYEQEQDFGDVEMEAVPEYKDELRGSGEWRDDIGSGIAGKTSDADGQLIGGSTKGIKDFEVGETEAKFAMRNVPEADLRTVTRTEFEFEQSEATKPQVRETEATFGRMEATFPEVGAQAEGLTADLVGQPEVAGMEQEVTVEPGLDRALAEQSAVDMRGPLDFGQEFEGVGEFERQLDFEQDLEQDLGLETEQELDQQFQTDTESELGFETVMETELESELALEFEFESESEIETEADALGDRRDGLADLSGGSIYERQIEKDVDSAAELVFGDEFDVGASKKRKKKNRTANTLGFDFGEL